MNRQFDDSESRNNTLEETSDSDFVNDSITSTPDRSYNYKVSSRDTSIDHKVSSRETSVNSSRHVTSHYHGPIKSNSCFLKKQLWFGVIVGSVLSILIAVIVVYFVTKSDHETENTVNVNAHVFRFDQSTLYHDRFLSEDGLTLSNRISKATPVSSVKNSNTLNTYQGVIGNKCFDNNSKIYFEVEYEFNVIGSIYLNSLIFEVGLAERDKVDNFYYVGWTQTNGWSFYLSICNYTDGNTCVSAEHNGTITEQFPWHQIVLGSKYSGKFGFFVNTSQNKFSIDLNSRTVFSSFRNVPSDKRLCPVFGVYNPNRFNVKLTLS